MLEILMMIYILGWGVLYFCVMKNEPHATAIDSIMYALVGLLWPMMLIDATLTKIYSLFKYRD